MAQFVPFYEEIESLNTDVVAVSFGTPYWAKAWLQETQAPVSVWLDPEKESYRVYGLERSVWRSWGPKNLWFYARALMRGEKLQEKRGDTDQLGGNFIMDAQGIVRFAYPTRFLSSHHHFIHPREPTLCILSVTTKSNKSTELGLKFIQRERILWISFGVIDLLTKLLTIV